LLAAARARTVAYPNIDTPGDHEMFPANAYVIRRATEEDDAVLTSLSVTQPRAGALRAVERTPSVRARLVAGVRVAPASS